MKRILVILTMLFTANLFCQENQSCQQPFWEKGDVFVGVSSDLVNLSAFNLSLSPNIGYAISDKDMAYGSFYYSKGSDHYNYSIGYNRIVCSKAFLGGEFSFSGNSDNWDRYIALNAGFIKKVNGWLYIMPKLSVGNTWDSNNNDLTVRTTINFSVKL